MTLIVNVLQSPLSCREIISIVVFLSLLLFYFNPIINWYLKQCFFKNNKLRNFFQKILKNYRAIILDHCSCHEWTIYPVKRFSSSDTRDNFQNSSSGSIADRSSRILERRPSYTRIDSEWEWIDEAAAIGVTWSSKDQFDKLGPRFDLNSCFFKNI